MGRGCPRDRRGQGCGDGRVLVLILVVVLLLRSHAASRENFGLCVLKPFGKGVRPGILCLCLLSRGCGVCWAADAALAV